MNLHANARTCPNSRRLLVGRIEEEGWSLTAAAEAAGVSERTARKWVARWRSEGARGLEDRSSAPKLIPHRTPPPQVELIEKLRRLRMTAAEIAEVLDMALSTVSVWLRRLGLGKRSPSRAARAAQPLRALSPRRARPRRRQEAGALQARRASGDGLQARSSHPERPRRDAAAASSAGSSAT